jgi:hypothetical protein
MTSIPIDFVGRDTDYIAEVLDNHRELSADIAQTT